MYDLSSVERKIKKEGIDKFISDIISGNFPENVKESLVKCNIITGGYPNLSLIYSLA